MSGISNSLTLTILIERQPDGEYAAIDEANHDLGWPVGYGKTKRAAIDDLIAQMDERGLIDDGNPFPKPEEAPEVEAALIDLSPRDQELVERVLAQHPSLPVDEAI